MIKTLTSTVILLSLLFCSAAIAACFSRSIASIASCSAFAWACIAACFSCSMRSSFSFAVFHLLRICVQFCSDHTRSGESLAAKRHPKNDASAKRFPPDDVGCCVFPCRQFLSDRGDDRILSRSAHWNPNHNLQSLRTDDRASPIQRNNNQQELINAASPSF